MSEFGVLDQLQQQSSRSIIEAYFGWSRQIRDRATMDRKFEITSFKEGRLRDTTYNVSEVANLLDDAASLQEASIVKDLESLTLSSAHLLAALCKAAEVQFIPLQVDATEILNATVSLTAVELAEQRTGTFSRQLAPIDRGDNTAKQLVLAHEEIRRLNEKLRLSSQQLSQVLQEKSQLTQELFSLRDAVQQASAEFTSNRQDNVVASRAIIESNQQTIASLRSEVAALQRELTGKLAHTSQFITLKNLLAEKNHQVKEMRTLLQQYCPGMYADANAADDIEIEDDD